MYRAVIICLISIGCVAAVPQLHYENRQIRQSNQAVPTSVQNATQSPYAIPTYPTYPVYPSYTTINPVEPNREKEALSIKTEAVAVTPVAETPVAVTPVAVKTVETPVNTTSVVKTPPSTISKVLPYLKTFAQFLVTVLLSTSFVGLFCTYTPICSIKFIGDREARIHLLISSFQAALEALSKFAQLSIFIVNEP